MLVAAVAISFSGILFRLADVSRVDGRVLALRVGAAAALVSRARSRIAATGRAYRRAQYARVDRGRLLRGGSRALAQRRSSYVGAGLATVLGNTQVVLVGLLAWALLGEQPHRSSLAAIPIVGFGVVLISGVLEQGAYGSNPAARCRSTAC